MMMVQATLHLSCLYILITKYCCIWTRAHTLRYVRGVSIAGWLVLNNEAVSS